MADKKISALTGATTPLAGTEVLPIVQSSATVKVSVANLTAGRAVSTAALSVVAADATFDNAFGVKGKLLSGTGDYLIIRNSSDQVAIDPSGYNTVIGFSGYRLEVAGGNATLQNGNFVVTTSGKGVTLPGGITWTSGAGSPEGVVTAPIGSLYSRSDGGLLTSLYVKESGAGNTGWVGK